MKDTLKSWLFFTSLMLFLLTAALVVPELLDGLLGDTKAQIHQAVTNMEQEAQAVWAEFLP